MQANEKIEELKTVNNMYKLADLPTIIRDLEISLEYTQKDGREFNKTRVSSHLWRKRVNKECSSFWYGSTSSKLFEYEVHDDIMKTGNLKNGAIK